MAAPTTMPLDQSLTNQRSAGKMRARQRPTSRHGPVSTTSTAIIAPSRKIFNCIVDDTALVAGVKRSTRNGIRQWVRNGQIRLFVPLHALEQLSRQKTSNNRHGQDVRETLEWLDDATSDYPNAVTLQGGDQFYQDWSEVEAFAVPRTLFSEQDHLDDEESEPEVEDLHDEAMSKLALSSDKLQTPNSSVASAGSGSGSLSSTRSLRSSSSAPSPPTSPTRAIVSIAKPSISAGTSDGNASSSAIVPTRLQSLLNYILWRIHQELDPVAALESFIFLCNDPSKVHYARGFDVRSKRLEQLREAVGREDRDFKNRQSMHARENHVPSSPIALPKPLVETDGDVKKSPPRAPSSMVVKQLSPAQTQEAVPQSPNVIDPNAFSRAPLPTNPQNNSSFVTESPGQTRNQSHHLRSRGGNNASPRGASRGGYGIAQRGRGNSSPRAAFASLTPESNKASRQGPIDPESFTRSRGGPAASRGGRKLWVPE